MKNELRIYEVDYDYKPTAADAKTARDTVALRLGVTRTRAMELCADVVGVSTSAFQSWCYGSDGRTMPNNLFILLKMHIDKLV